MDSLNNRNKKFYFDRVIMIIVISLPFSFYLYTLIPNNIKRIDFLFLEIKSGYYSDINELVWLCSTKILTLMVLSIWFITNQNAWRWILTLPIIYEVYKLIHNIRMIEYGFDYSSLDVYETFQYSIPFLVVLIYISKILGYQNKENKLRTINDEINQRFQRISNLTFKDYKEIKVTFENLKKHKSVENKKIYLSELIAFRDRLNSL